MSDSHVDIFWSEEDGRHVMDIPGLEHGSAFGSTPQEALEEVQVAKEAWLETVRDRGLPIPQPRYRPEPAAASR